ncbi:hypothetical protein [Shinella sp. BYT-45]|uniref:hypothetical protein n=1 Tax=Shinella sp. BYT-45 TaxID=3377377 RepID=UPI00397EF584
MSTVLHDDTISNDIIDLVMMILPYTAPGKTMPATVAEQLVRRLSVLRRYATKVEMELSIHRLGEAGATARAGLDRESVVVLDEFLRDPEGKVVKVDFDGGRKK